MTSSKVTTRRLGWIWPSWLAPFFSQCFFFFLGSWAICPCLGSWLWSPPPFPSRNVPRAPLVAPSIPEPSPLPADDTIEEKTRDGAAQFILSKNVPIPSTSRLWPGSLESPVGWTSKVSRGSADGGEGGVLGCGGWWSEDRRAGQRAKGSQPLSLWGACLNLLFLGLTGYHQDRAFKMHLLETYYKMMSNITQIRRNSIMNPVFQHSASITTKLPSESHRLS